MTIKVCHLISSLRTGGAQVLLRSLCAGAAHGEFEHVVICLTERSELANQIEREGSRVYCLEASKPSRLLRVLRQAERVVASEHPDVLHSWLYHADLLGAYLRLRNATRPLIWSVHHANAELRRERFFTRCIMRVLASMSRYVPDTVVYCSEYARDIHQELGYQPRSSVVIENGIDIRRFSPSSLLRHRFRSELNVDAKCPLVGIVGRFSPIKDYPTFVASAALLAQRVQDVRFIMVGTGVDAGNSELMAMLGRARLLNRCHLLGERSDVDAVLNGIDVLVSTSISESFGLVLAEALACGTPAVGTDLKMTRSIVGEEFTAPVGDAGQLAQRVQRVLCMPEQRKQELKERSRQRVIADYDERLVHRRYWDTYAFVTDEFRGRRAAGVGRDVDA